MEKSIFWRIWSTDWFYNPRRESERLFAFLKEREEIMGSEPAPYFESESDFEEIGETEQPPSAGTTEVTTVLTLSSSEEELYVEVGDSVTYCYVDTPDDRLTVTIVEGESNPKLNLSNENSPVAQALLNCAIGDEPELRVTGSGPRVLRLLKIQRQQNLWNLETTAFSEQTAIRPDPLLERSIRTRSEPIETPEPRHPEFEMLRSSNETWRSVEPGRTPGSRIVDELRNLDGRFENPLCSSCGGGKAHLAINNEGPVFICESGGCNKFERVDIQTLQRIADRLGVTCFRCKGANLSSQTGKFSNYLRCRDCDTNNSWQRASERIGN